MNNPLFDFEFLEELMNYPQREVHARITLLTNEETPISQVEGRVTGGSINVDGNSALRRTCNLSMILKEQSEINQFDWTFKRRFKLEIGLTNFINAKYPNVIWFKQGIFIMTSYDMNQTVNNYTITINGKDKMCLLNGDISGSLPQEVDFGTIETYDSLTNTSTIESLPLKTIIYEAVHNYGNEIASNIIINDLDDIGAELLEYRNEEDPLYMLRSKNTQDVEQLILNGDHEVYEYPSLTPVKLKDIAIYATMSNLLPEVEEKPIDIVQNTDDNIIYNVMKLEYGDIAGYRPTNLTYPGELVGKVGESLTSVLDKIKNMLSEFEYFYNIDGKFIFQKKRKYISTPWNNLENDSNDSILHISDTLPRINLTNSKLVISFANKPNLSNLKNDFCVWGQMQTISGGQAPIHMRYAIDTKPTYYKTIRYVKQEVNGKEKFKEKDCDAYGPLISKTSTNPAGDIITNYYIKNAFTVEDWDWRELIYQMALDYRKGQENDDFFLDVAAANKDHYPTGRTGYEQYYTDLEGFWRLLYDPNPDAAYISASAIEAGNEEVDRVYVNNPHRKLTDEERTALQDYFDGKSEGECPIPPDNLFIVDTITVKENNNNVSKRTFYPFIGSKLCCLYNDENHSDGPTYYYADKDYFKSSADHALLNLKPIKSLYALVDGIRSSVVDLRYKSALQNNDLWIKDGGRLAFSDLDPICQEIYRGGENKIGFIEFMHNWSIIDNYGTKSTTQETSYKIDYVIENLNGDYFNLGKNHWNKTVSENPEQLYFWFDFLDAEQSELYNYSTKLIGARTKAVNDTNVKAIYYREIPTTMFVTRLTDMLEEREPGYTYIQLPALYESLFSISGIGKSAKERIDELLYAHSHCAETATITTIPLYYLEPNTIIMIRDNASNISGEYLISKITIPLTYNGTMNLTATKIMSNL